MAIADDIINEFEEEQEEEYQQQSRPEYLEPVDTRPAKREQETVNRNQENEVPEKEPLVEAEEPNKLDIKQIIILVVSIAVAYAIIIQYKLLDPFLERYLLNTPIIVKRLGAFSIAISTIYLGLKLTE